MFYPKEGHTIARFTCVMIRVQISTAIISTVAYWAEIFFFFIVIINLIFMNKATTPITRLNGIILTLVAIITYKPFFYTTMRTYITIYPMTIIMMFGFSTEVTGFIIIFTITTNVTFITIFTPFMEVHIVGMINLTTIFTFP